MIPGGGRRWAAVAGVLIVATALAMPGIALGAASWTLTRSPASVMALSTANFSLVATNMGSGRQSNAIGCVTVAIPSQFTVNSATITNASGRVWTATVANGASSSTITVRASGNSQRLSAKKLESVSFTVNVTAGLVLGAYQWTGNAFIGFDCSGSYGQPVTLSVTIGALPINLPPLASPDVATVPEDGTLLMPAPGVLANDLDADGDPLIAQLDSAPSYGTVALAADGSFTYVPAPGYSGADTFGYRAGDGSAWSLPTLVSVAVAPVNDPPVATDDSYAALEATTLSVPAPGVLGNDSDVDAPTLSAQLVTPPTHGTLSLQSNGAFTYLPATGFAGADAFGYRASDGLATSTTATVTIKVAPNGTPLPTPPGSTARPTPTPTQTVSPGETPVAQTPLPTSGPASSVGGSSPPGQTDRPAALPALPLPPLALPPLALARGDDGATPPMSLDLAFAGLGYDWFIPAAAIAGPGLLVMGLVALQLVGGLAWMPAVRRHLGGAGKGRPRRSP